MNLRPLLLAAIVAASPIAATAHTPLTGSVPESGTILNASPPAISLTFAGPVRLTKLSDLNGTKERRLSFSPTSKSETFTAQSPNLPAGRNELRWKALSEDGHVMEGTILVIIRPKP
jgi:methionine-rich copper-binding protein CopC